MSSFNCEQCGKVILDSPKGYITECKHYRFSGEDIGYRLKHEERDRILKQMEDNKAAQFNVRPRKP